MAGLLLDNATTAPPAGARAVSATVPAAVPPPCRVAGLSFTEVNAAATAGAGAAVVVCLGVGVAVGVEIAVTVGVVVGAGLGAGLGADTVQPDSTTLSAVGEPSLTSTVQSAGRVYPDQSTRKLPALLLVAILTPSTVIGRFVVARPSMRSVVPLTSAWDTLTTACAGAARLTSRTASTVRVINTRFLRPVTSTS